jgi:uncharacterized membrane protein
MMTDPLYSEPLSMRSPLEDVLDDKTYVIIVYVLYLLSVFTGGLTAIIGLIMAYVLKPGAGPRAYSHYAFAIRTFWLPFLWALIGSAVLAVGCVLCAILIGIPIVIVAVLGLCALPIWFLVRCVIGLIAALDDRPYERPRAWML